MGTAVLMACGIFFATSSYVPEKARLPIDADVFVKSGRKVPPCRWRPDSIQEFVPSTSGGFSYLIPQWVPAVEFDLRQYFFKVTLVQNGTGGESSIGW